MTVRRGARNSATEYGPQGWSNLVRPARATRTAARLEIPKEGYRSPHQALIEAAVSRRVRTTSRDGSRTALRSHGGEAEIGGALTGGQRVAVDHCAGNQGQQVIRGSRQTCCRQRIKCTVGVKHDG